MFVEVLKAVFFLSLLSCSEFFLEINGETVQGVAVNESSVSCVRGEVVNGVCRCFSGWMGSSCSLCGGRIRLTGSSGEIVDNANQTSGSNYQTNSLCLFYLQADRPNVTIHVKVRLLHLECLWDYVHVFDGDSIYADKLASYTGNLIEEVLPSMDTTDSSNSSNQTMNTTDGGQRGLVLEPTHTLTSSGSMMMLYFYSDLAEERAGFNLSYWLDYECPNKCSDRGVCNSTTGECLCPPAWTGQACESPVCLNNCSGNGNCDSVSGQCLCVDGYEGMDCSVDVSKPHWSQVPFSSSTVSLDTLPRAGHSAVVLNSTHLLIYSGYRFTTGRSNPFTSDSAEEGRQGVVSSWTDGELLSFDLSSNQWEELNTSSLLPMLEEEGEEGEDLPRMQTSSTDVYNDSVMWNVTSDNSTADEDQPVFPSPRYGHTAVIYNMSMYVFGGSLYPSENFTSDLWELDLNLWEWQPLFSLNTPISRFTSPVPVRDHTAHVVGSKMVVLYGLSFSRSGFFSLIQEYDFISGKWLVPLSSGAAAGFAGRAGHSSVHSEEDGLIYIYGGRGSGGILDQLLSYDPFEHVFSLLKPSGSQRYLHTLTQMGHLLLSFAGCQNNRDCFSSHLDAYDTRCNTWQRLDLPGLLANDSRFKHSAVLVGGSLLVGGGYVGTLRGDVLRLTPGNCSRWRSLADCEKVGPLCIWEESSSGDSCVPLTLVSSINFSTDCPGNTSEAAGCNMSCSDCLSSVNCSYDACKSLHGDDCPQSPPVRECLQMGDCQGCRVLGCSWEAAHGKESCYTPSSPSTGASPDRQVVSSCSVSCYQHTSCNTCLGSSCLWCPSLSRCFPGNNNGYPSTFTFGQCLGWTKDLSSCAREDCGVHHNCSSCQVLPHCGWCNDPSNTGLGECLPGGFQAPLEGSTSSCLAAAAGMLGVVGNASDLVELGEWQFDLCSACQCNGHSTCLNKSSICIECQDNTTGSNCDLCALGGFGDPRNGGMCQECNCNGYNDVCNITTGVCQCRTQGVGGDFCTNCTGDYGFGSADNFCFARLRSGFIYTYQISDDFVDDAYYAVTPTANIDLDVTFELVDGTGPVEIQFFLGRVSENLWVLARISDTVIVDVKKNFQRLITDFGYSNETESKVRLTSYAKPSIRNTENFTRLFESVNANDYSRHIWDRDVTLIIRVTGLSNTTIIRITVEQQNFLFLLYFFATFITCFSLLLTIFLIAWYIKRKLAYRSFVRQQYIELQRRVARPFAKIMVLLDRQTAAQVCEEKKEQYPSYVAVETCKNEKAAILSLLVRLPGDHKTGLPSLGRTGVCLGSTMVHVSNKKPKTGGARQRKKDHIGRNGERREGEGRGRLLSDEGTVVRNGRGGQSESSASAAAESV